MYRTTGRREYDPAKMKTMELRDTLCPIGPKACGECESACGYGLEWLRRNGLPLPGEEAAKREAARRAAEAEKWEWAEELRRGKGDGGPGDRGPGDAGAGDGGPGDAGAGDGGPGDAGADDGGPGDGGQCRPVRRKNRYTIDQARRMERMADDGRTIREIARETGLEWNAVYYVLRRRAGRTEPRCGAGDGRKGAKAVTERGKATEARRAEAAGALERMLRGGMTISEAAKAMGRTYQQAYGIARHHCPQLIKPALSRPKPGGVKKRNTRVILCRDCRHCLDVDPKGGFWCALFGMQMYAPRFSANDFYCRGGIPKIPKE